MSDTYETPAINPQTPSFVVLPPGVPCSNCAPIRTQNARLREALERISAMPWPDSEPPYSIARAALAEEEA